MSTWDDTNDWPPSSQRYYSEPAQEKEEKVSGILDLSEYRDEWNEGIRTFESDVPEEWERFDDDPPKLETGEKDAPKTPREQHLAFLKDPKVRSMTVLNPDFLTSFYSNSRLHHLSTWRAELKAQFQALTASQPPRVLPKRIKRRYILHIDFDSFFCAVSLLSRPDLIGKPVCVCHGSSSGSSNEVASVNYIAREYGVKNGMWMAQVKKLCPDIVVLPYDFPGYERASGEFYKVLVGVGADKMMGVSVDEALLDVTSLCISTEDEPPGTQEQVQAEYVRVEEISKMIRDQVRERTKCEVSVGCGGNILLAKLALRKAKPGGQFHLRPDDVLAFLDPLKPESLPGVGSSTAKKLSELDINTVGEIRVADKDFLRKHCGDKTGDRLWEYARGIDSTELSNGEGRKSVTADINWGVRFENSDQISEFLQRLSTELARRLEVVDLVGRHLTLKVMVRAKDAPVITPKFLGCGRCDTFNKSVDLPVAVGEGGKIFRTVDMLMRQFGFPAEEVRGLGLSMTKLESRRGGESARQRVLGFKRGEKVVKEEPAGGGESVREVKKENGAIDGIDTEMYDLPPDIDLSVLKALPEDILKEVLVTYRRPKPTPLQSSTNRSPSSSSSIIPKRSIKRQIRLPVVKSANNTASLGKVTPSQQWGQILGSKRPHSDPPVQERETKRAYSSPSPDLPVTSSMESLHVKEEPSKQVQEPDYQHFEYTVPLEWPPFHTLTTPSEILLLVMEWLEGYRSTGPHEQDVGEWTRYLEELAEERRELARGIVRWFEGKVGKLEKGEEERWGGCVRRCREGVERAARGG